MACLFCSLAALHPKSRIRKPCSRFKPTEQIDKIPLTRAEEGYVQAGNAFAWKLFQKVWDGNTSKESFIISPLSVQYALGMLGNGADQEVSAKVAQVLGYSGTDAINAYCSKMIQCLPMVDTTVTLALADGVVVNDKFTLKAPFRSAMEDSYDALVEPMSFEDPDKVLKWINDWCEQHTFGRIKNALDYVYPLAVVYLLNAIYFNGAWQASFDPADTRSENFKTFSGASRKVKMMHQDLGERYYAESDLCQMISLGYGRGMYQMNIYLPKKASDLPRLIADPGKNLQFERAHVILSLPSFETAFRTDLLAILYDMGLPVSPYTEMAETSLEISRIIHKANITVNEKRTEAAAVTIVELRFTSNLSQPEPRTVNFTADHPFLYTITEASTGAIHFAGVYTGK